MVSTLASGQVRHYVGDKDILMLNSVVDLSGLNRITAHRSGAKRRAPWPAWCSFRRSTTSPRARRPPVGRRHDVWRHHALRRSSPRVLEAAGYEVLVFHATGSGGQAMESLIDEGLIAGVLDITTTELADELVGGVLSAGPSGSPRPRAAACRKWSRWAQPTWSIFTPATTVPAKFAGRKFYQHNANVTLMRTTADGMRRDRRATSDASSRRPPGRWPCSLPARGVSALDRRRAAVR